LNPIHIYSERYRKRQRESNRDIQRESNRDRQRPKDIKIEDIS
jgi:hypothetical protein